MEKNINEIVISKIENKIKSDSETAKYYIDKLHTDNLDEVCSAITNNCTIIYTFNFRLKYLKDFLREIKYIITHDPKDDIKEALEELYNEYIEELINMKFIETSNRMYDLQEQCKEEALKKHIQYLNTLKKNL